MELYFSPLACSMATRIALYEGQLPVSFVRVDTKAGRTDDGRDFKALNPLGLVPTLRSADGELWTENAAILQHVAECAGPPLAPPPGRERTRLQQWLCFIGTELHKGVFHPLLDKQAPEGARSYALGHASSRLLLLEAHLARRSYLLDAFSVADAYLFTVLNWAQVTPVKLDPYPQLLAYLGRLRERDSIKRALAEELALYSASRR